MKPSSLLTSLTAFAAAVAGFSVLEELRGVPEGWTEIGSPQPETRLRLRINVVQEKQDHVEQTIINVATPQHPSYGQHLSYEELKDLTRPSASATESIINWLKSSEVESIEDDGDWISFITTVFQAEEMLNTRFHYYRSDVNGMDILRTLQYSIPEHLQNTIYMIQPTIRFGQIRPQFNSIFNVQPDLDAKVQISCNATITPKCLKDLYKVKGKGSNTKNGFLGTTGFLGQYARFADLQNFEKQFAKYAKGTSFSVVKTNGGKFNQNSPKSSFEANLDVQYGIGVGYPIPNRFYTTAGRAPLVPDNDQPDASNSQNEPYTDFLHYILKLPNDKLPHTLTTSYAENEQNLPERYNRAVCSMFGQLGARGVSVIFASGDTGVGSACETNDGKNTTRFLPTFPAACPHVTSVGGTHYIEPEKAIGFSSGGFSDRYSRPKYQDKAVKAYLKKLGNQWKGLYNPKGRGFPDVAAQAQNFRVVDKGSNTLVTGTSASAPTFAAIIAKLNSARIEAGMRPLGFLNPWIYGGAYKALNDITLGGSTGCTGTDKYSGVKTPYVPYASWNATKGWDPVTGWGTPNFQKLLQLAVPGKYD